MHVRTQARHMARAALGAVPDFAGRVAAISFGSTVDASGGPVVRVATDGETAERLTMKGKHSRGISLQVAIWSNGAGGDLDDEIDRLSVLVEQAVMTMDDARALAHRIDYEGAEIENQTGATETIGRAILSFVVVVVTAANDPTQAEV